MCHGHDTLVGVLTVLQDDHTSITIIFTSLPTVTAPRANHPHCLLLLCAPSYKKRPHEIICWRTLAPVVRTELPCFSNNLSRKLSVGATFASLLRFLFVLLPVLTTFHKVWQGSSTVLVQTAQRTRTREAAGKGLDAGWATFKCRPPAQMAAWQQAVALVPRHSALMGPRALGTVGSSGKERHRSTVQVPLLAAARTGSRPPIIKARQDSLISLRVIFGKQCVCACMCLCLRAHVSRPFLAKVYFDSENRASLVRDAQFKG